MFKGFAVIDILRSLRRQSAGANRAVGQVGKALWVLGLSAGFTAMCVGLPSCDWMVDEEVEVDSVLTEHVFVNDTDHSILIKSSYDSIRVDKRSSRRLMVGELRDEIFNLTSAEVVFDDTITVEFLKRKSVLFDNKEVNFLRYTYECNGAVGIYTYTFTEADYQYALQFSDEAQDIIRPLPVDSVTDSDKQ
ncbi:MAG: hypothetical protein K6G31_09760 [Paludibacteraceae bacterium]|nr:hypothetical protein [Paludibacteraceae bacterium]